MLVKKTREAATERVRATIAGRHNRESRKLRNPKSTV
jgi:hypothetical protein